MTKTQLRRLNWGRAELTRNMRSVIGAWLTIGYDVSSLESSGSVVLKHGKDRVMILPSQSIKSAIQIIPLDEQSLRAFDTIVSSLSLRGDFSDSSALDSDLKIFLYQSRVK